MKYPRYTREQKLSCKLTEEDIENIRRDFKSGLLGIRELGRKYKVRHYAILYWTNEDFRQREIKRVKTGKETKESRRKQFQRKWLIQPAYRDYVNFVHRKNYKKALSL